MTTFTRAEAVQWPSSSDWSSVVGELVAPSSRWLGQGVASLSIFVQAAVGGVQINAMGINQLEEEASKRERKRKGKKIV